MRKGETKKYFIFYRRISSSRSMYKNQKQKTANIFLISLPFAVQDPPFSLKKQIIIYIFLSFCACASKRRIFALRAVFQANPKMGNKCFLPIDFSHAFCYTHGVNNPKRRIRI